MATYDDNVRRTQAGGIGAPDAAPSRIDRLVRNTALEPAVAYLRRPDQSRVSADIYGTGDMPPNFAGLNPPPRTQPTPVLGRPAAAAPTTSPITSSGAPSLTRPRPIAPVWNASADRIRADGQSNEAAAAMSSTRPGTAVINGNVIEPGRIATLSRPVPASTSTPAAATTPMLSRPQVLNGYANPSEAARMAESDLASIATGDWRSPVGLAARNARVEASTTPTRIGTSRGERAVMRDRAAAGADGIIGALANNAMATAQGSRDAANLAMQEAGADRRSERQAQVDLASIRRPQLQPMTLADGTAAQVGEDGVARPVVGLDGRPVSLQRGRAPTDQAAFAKIYEQNFTRLLGADPTTGLIVDEQNPRGRQPTPEEMQRATAAARSLTMDALGNDGNDGTVFVDANGNRARLINGQYVPE